ncbi:MAG: M48 family metalloprotease [Pseudomonadota bacterium]
MRTRPFQGFLIPLLLAAAAASFTSGCATNPVTGTPDLVFMSEAKEIQLGNSYDGKVRSQYGIYADPALQAYVQEIGRKLAAQSHRPNLEYHFTVLDSDQVNAFALPGGHIYITRGILAYLDSEAELAAVLGHEIGHVTARHGVRQHAAATTTGVIGAVLGAATGIQATQDLFSVFGNAMLSGYGRDHELESDRLGAEYLARAGYDPQAMIRVVGVLKNQEEFEKKRAEAEKRAPQIYHGVFATHPSADQRLQEVVGEADKFKTLSAPRVEREAYLKHLDKLAYGDSAGGGVRRGSRFYHRDMDFTLRFPDGWILDNQARVLYGVSPDKLAVLRVEAEDLAKDLPAEEFLKTRLKGTALEQAGPVPGLAGPSHTGVVKVGAAFGKRPMRVAVVDHRDKRFLFQGAARDATAFAAHDPLFLQTIGSLRLLTGKEKRLAEGWRVHVVRARPGDSFASLAKTSPLAEHAELTLRLINGKFPDGEPRAGEPIKIIE